MNDEPIQPTEAQIYNAELLGWVYDAESFIFEKDNLIGYFTENGFIKH